MYSALRRLLFAAEAERAHDLAMGALALTSRSQSLSALLAACAGNRGQLALPHTVMGIEFANPVGLAAGLDKHARASNALHALGFGWLELGTVTPLPQPGNPKPRLFRLKQHDALINRMGFNSDGMEIFLQNIAHAERRIIKGINIGKNTATGMQQAMDDYLVGLEAVHAHADYVAINISSPNTPKLRELQQADALDPLLRGLNRKRMALADACGRRVPLVLKIAPDLDHRAINHIAELSRKHQIDGLAGNQHHAAAQRPGTPRCGAPTGRLERAAAGIACHRNHPPTVW